MSALPPQSPTTRILEAEKASKDRSTKQAEVAGTYDRRIERLLLHSKTSAANPTCGVKVTFDTAYSAVVKVLNEQGFSTQEDIDEGITTFVRAMVVVKTSQANQTLTGCHIYGKPVYYGRLLDPNERQKLVGEHVTLRQFMRGFTKLTPAAVAYYEAQGEYYVPDWLTPADLDEMAEVNARLAANLQRKKLIGATKSASVNEGSNSPSSQVRR